MSKRKVATQDLCAALVLTCLFVVMLSATWQRWTDPEVDHGREMSLPVRLLAGETLYNDISYQYGPFSPYFNALLYRMFGVHLSTLHASGAICAVLILMMIYWMARRLMDPWESALATALVLVTCAINANYGNYIQPYAYAALHGWTFALASLVCATLFVEHHASVWMLGAGIFLGGVLVCKPELALLVMVPAGTAVVLDALQRRRLLFAPIGVAAAPAMLITGLTYGVVLRRVPWDTLVGETLRMLSQPQMVQAASVASGFANWSLTIWSLLASTGMTLVAFAAAPLMGLALSPKVESLWRGRARPAWGLLLLGVSLWWYFRSKAPELVDVNPFKSAPIVLVAMIGVLIAKAWRAGRKGESLSRDHQILLIIGVFALIGIDRVILNVAIRSGFTPFTIPGLILVDLYLCYRTLPKLLLVTPGSRAYARASAMGVTALLIAGLALFHGSQSRTRFVFPIAAPRGRLLTHPVLGRPIADALRLVLDRTSPKDYVASLPGGTIVNFLAERRNPLREEQVLPGVLTPEREAEAIRRLADRHVPLILVSNIGTPQYGQVTFGVDYNRRLMHWIESHYHLIATFSAGNDLPQRFVGSDAYFIRAFERNREPDSRTAN